MRSRITERVRKHHKALSIHVYLNLHILLKSLKPHLSPHTSLLSSSAIMVATEIAIFPMKAGSDVGDPDSAGGQVLKDTFDTLKARDGM